MTTATAKLVVPFTRPTDDRVEVDTIPEAVAALDAAMATLQDAVGEVADQRARWIAHLAASTSVRTAAEALDMSPAAVSKAVARAELSGSTLEHMTVDEVDEFVTPIGRGMRPAGRGPSGVDMSDPSDHGIVRPIR